MIKQTITIKLIPREDGGLRITSDDEYGLVLSGADPGKVMASVLPALDALDNYRRKHQ